MFVVKREQNNDDVDESTRKKSFFVQIIVKSFNILGNVTAYINWLKAKI